MSVPGVGYVRALSFMAAVGDPMRTLPSAYQRGKAQGSRHHRDCSGTAASLWAIGQEVAPAA
ncbi:hypothetical protein E2F50_21770 [Rhizobium deserti]|uniref:Uncharacterized protein n=1 Tax=Rhizobium deserti TaxID=2547961 RepID=A0A4R5U715_9HYPH|nr:hypothetical protein E2F50_21770 [Rhizobium deserti]